MRLSVLDRWYTDYHPHSSNSISSFPNLISSTLSSSTTLEFLYHLREYLSRSEKSIRNFLNAASGNTPKKRKFRAKISKSIYMDLINKMPDRIFELIRKNEGNTK